MKAIIALLFSTAFAGACGKTDGSVGYTEATKCTCGSLAADACGKGVADDAADAAKHLCVKSGNVEKCDTLANLVAVSLCTDAKAATADCICAATAPAADATPADIKMCAKDETCTTADGKCAAADTKASATMITAFATIMTTAFFSF